MNKKDPFFIRVAHWPEDSATLCQVRYEVFVIEHSVTEDEEWDGQDGHCQHVLAFDEHQQAIGTARMFPEGRIGRMAVIKPWRGRGVGRALLLHLVQRAQRSGLPQCELHAQTHAVGFYEKNGFTVVGAQFMDANIAHRKMVRIFKS